MKQFSLVYVILVCFAATQSPSQVSPATMTSNDIRRFLVTPGIVSTNAEFLLDPAPGVEDLLILHYTDPALLFSLVRPDNVEVTASNAAALGYSFTSFSPDAPPSIVNFTGVKGRQLWIGVPAGSPAGIHRIKIDATGTSVQSLVFGVYLSSSPVKVAVTTSVPRARPGDPVKIVAAVFDGQTPVQGATARARIQYAIPAPQVSLVNFTLVSQATLPDSTVRYTFRGNASNAGPAAELVRARASSTDPSITLVSPGLSFGNIDAGSSSQSEPTLVFVGPAAPPPNPASFSWRLEQEAAPIDVDLFDSGPVDAIPGDGGYSGQFTPAVAAEYRIGIKVSGVSASSVPFSRANATTINVASYAQILSIADQLVS